MKSSLRAGLLLMLLLLSGCAGSRPAQAPPTPALREDSQALSLVSYPGTGNPKAVIARMDGAELTNEELQFWYAAEAAQYRQEQHPQSPDFSLPLDAQPCPLKQNTGSWQQYFLEAALNRWHTAQALIRHSQEHPLPLEEAYKGNPETLDSYMAGMPAAKLLYGYDPSYRPNSLHQAYLDSLEEAFSGPRLEMVRALNYGYMYFTTLTYDLDIPQTEATGEPRVRIRHILLQPEEGEDSCIQRAMDLLNTWQKGRNASESTFAQLASQHSRDTASAGLGGLYAGVRRDQLPDTISRWCFDESRQPGDTALIPLGTDVHLLYFAAAEPGLEARRAETQAAQEALLEQIRTAYPVRIDREPIFLTEEAADASLSQLLYPDIAHERFPEIPLYLQQNYLGTRYGEYKLTTNGCGITSFAMVGSYLSDEELTPPEMAAMFGRYSRVNGTSGSLFEEGPAQLGFYLVKKTYDWREVREYLQAGHCAISCQHKGYWTSGGHYLVLETLTEDGLVQVRDSNMCNYRKLPRHKEDAFPWDTISCTAHGFWIFEKKAAAMEACTRCGHPEALETPLVSGYLCEKCGDALCRRNAYLHNLPS